MWSSLCTCVSGRGGEGDRWRSRSVRTERKDYLQIQLQWLPEEPPWSEHFGRKGFWLFCCWACCWTWRGVSCNIDGVYLYICLSVCPLQLEMMLMLGTRLERREKKITGHRYIFYRSLSTLHCLSSYQLFIHSSILLLLFFLLLPLSPLPATANTSPPPRFLSSSR